MAYTGAEGNKNCGCDCGVKLETKDYPEIQGYSFISNKDVARWKSAISLGIISTQHHDTHLLWDNRLDTRIGCIDSFIGYIGGSSISLKNKQGTHECTLTLKIDGKIVFEKNTPYALIMERWIYDCLNELEKLIPHLFTYKYEDSLVSYFLTKDDRDFYGAYRFSDEDKKRRREL